MSTTFAKLKQVHLNELVGNPKNDIVDGPFGSLLKATEYVDEGIPIVRLQNIDRNHFIDKNIKFVTKRKAKEIARHHFVPGDILISKLGNPLGEACIAPDHFPYGILVADVVRVRPNKVKVDTNFLTYALNSSQVAKQFEDETKGTTRPRVNLKKIRDLEIPFVDSLDEQRRIVAEIEKQFTRLEAGMVALKRVQINLKRYRAAVLKAACEGRLVPTEADLARQESRSYETGEQLLARILTRRREVFDVEKSRGSPKKYKEPSEIEPGLLPFIPEGWTLASAEAICSSVRDGTHDTPAYVSDGVPLITSKNLLPTGLDFDNVKLVSRSDYDEIAKRSGVERGDILFAMIGTIGNPVVVETDREFSIKNVGLFKANIDFILPRYLRYWFMSPTFTHWLDPKQKGTTQKFVPLGLLRALVVALPPFAEQKRIIEEVERRLSVVEELEALVTGNLQRASRLRQSIMQMAFSAETFSQKELRDETITSSGRELPRTP